MPQNIIIDYGLYIRHGGPVVVRPTTRIGDSCNFSIYKYWSNENYAAVIRNNTNIDPNVKIVEKVYIWNSVSIKIGSVVKKIFTMIP